MVDQTAINHPVTVSTMEGWLIWPDMAGHGRPWPAMAGHGRPWLAMAGHDRPWPAMAGHGRP